MNRSEETPLAAAISESRSIQLLDILLLLRLDPEELLELGGTKGSIGLLTTISSLTALLVQLPGGVISDRLGRKRVILLSSVLGFLPPIIFRYSFLMKLISELAVDSVRY